MSDQNEKSALSNVNHEIKRYMADIFRCGNVQFNGSGDGFIIQAASMALQFLVGCRHIVNKGPIEFDRLNMLCAQSPWAFCELDVPDDEVYLHGILLSKIFINGMAQRRAHGEDDEGRKLTKLNALICESAIEAVKMVGEDKASESILAIARMTAEELAIFEAEDRRKMKAMRQPAQGHA